MANLKPILFQLLFTTLIFVSGCVKDHTSLVIEKHLEKYPDIRKKYLYQSVIRLANTSGDSSFNKLIKDLRKVIIYLPPEGDSTYQITGLRQGMREAGYEELMDVRTADKSRISLWVDESTKPHYMGMVDTDDEDIIFEMDGQLDLKYLSSVKFTDQSSIMDLLK